ncbi:hypothetical protein DWX58_03555 [Pseudoflavonifractor sp. AF19-9AC]|uniref:cucumopine synthase-related protein n=1 Tax=Pseudoflavonifractor sp. AF19-9AC TaxID=2292244 RepID=UPI000E4FFED3|nr:hypothetical protein [Pseudoflavonifractor sp. AF19-9AC]RHR10485.1 hypothetical protein DWX58_03555 [Pseudoflavonifractor sp. AF19-9AC]
MAMDWRDVKAEIEAEIDKIWFDEPLELTLSKRGIFPSGAGAHQQAFGNFVFLFADTHAIGGFVIEAPMYSFVDNPSFTLDHCKTIFTAINMNKCRIMGANHGPDSKCPAAWLNMPKFQKFYLDIEACLDTVKTKEEFKSLLWSWFNYVDRFNKWVYVLFPWSAVGDQMPLITGKDISPADLELCKEAGLF